tara:strand:- start:488 stop:814 length:327 start_codon:yes stop_codon:yes gene_type:complete
MGYYNKLEVEQQAKIDSIVRWYQAHADVLPAYLLNRILADDELLTTVIELWEETPRRRSASDHVALQVTNSKPKTDWSMTSDQAKIFIIIYGITMGLVLLGIVGLGVF